jgi:hypothetical protein
MLKKHNKIPIITSNERFGKRRKVIKIIILLVMLFSCSIMTGCIDMMEPHYIFTLDISVKHGVITNVTILLPLPTRDNKMFYGMEEYLGSNNTIGYDHRIINFEIVDTKYGKMFSISTEKVGKSKIYTCGALYQDNNINARNPLGNEYLLTPKLFIIERNYKLNGETLLATYKSLIYLQYNASNEAKVVIRYSYEGHNQDIFGRNGYYDRLEKIELKGCKSEWILVNGQISKSES